MPNYTDRGRNRYRDFHSAQDRAREVRTREVFDENDEDNPTFDADLVNETERAYLFKIDSKEHWVPKSVCSWNPQLDQVSGKATIARWFADKEQIDY